MRYLRLYFTYIKRSIASRLEYKIDTFITILSFLLSNVCSILSIYFIMESIPALDGWNIYMLGFLYGFSMMPVALDHLFTDELWAIAYFRVRNGSVDGMLIRPVPVLFQVIAETFQPEGFGELIVGVVMLVLCSFKVSVNWNFASVFMLVTASVFGAVVITSFKIIFSSMAFKFKRSGPLLQIAYNFISYTRYPMSIYPAFLRAMLTFVFPFAVIISLPVEVFFGVINFSPYVVSIIITGVAAILLPVAIVIWSAFLKTYESTGS